MQYRTIEDVLQSSSAATLRDRKDNTVKHIIAIGAPLHLAARLCSPAYAFGGGRVWLVQYRVAEYDQNYAC